MLLTELIEAIEDAAASLKAGVVEEGEALALSGVLVVAGAVERPETVLVGAGMEICIAKGERVSCAAAFGVVEK